MDRFLRVAAAVPSAAQAPSFGRRAAMRDGRRLLKRKSKRFPLPALEQAFAQYS
jgi:hypothetical protein